MNCVSYDTFHFWYVCVVPWGIASPQSDWSCPVTTDLIMRVDVRTTTTTLSDEIQDSPSITSYLRSCWIRLGQSLVITLLKILLL